MKESGPLTTVVGGGIVGLSIAYGLVRRGYPVQVLDASDGDFRASRGNFALVWLQGKGFGTPDYTLWTAESIRAWPEFARELQEISGINIAYENNGGFQIALSDSELEARDRELADHNLQLGSNHYSYEILERKHMMRYFNGLGPGVAGASFGPLDGHVNSMRLLLALQTAVLQLGGQFRSNTRVSCVEAHGDRFIARGEWGEVMSDRIVLAGGVSNATLGSEMGLNVSVRPQRGQVMVTEKALPFMRYPISTIRQTDEGGVMIGDSVEEGSISSNVKMGIMSVMARRAITTFPALADVRVVRTWAALRVMTQDGKPIYEQSARHPGAFSLSCHSGVTLAAAHVQIMAEDIAKGQLRPKLSGFRNELTDVQTNLRA